MTGPSLNDFLTRLGRGEQTVVGPTQADVERRKVAVRVFRALGLTGMPALNPDLSIEQRQDGSVVIEWNRFAKNGEGRKIIDREGSGFLRERVRSTLTVSHKVVG